MKLDFKHWFNEMVGTGVVTGTHPTKKGTFNYWGAPGSTGVSIEGEPIKNWLKKPKKKKKKKNGK